tara:strand:- start:2912 stop:3271 length:360 start_codon:yes stop_codon:yes gene_type:complete
MNIPMVDEFTSAYFDASLWSSTDVIDGEDVALDSVDNELAAETIDTMVADCKRFQAENEQDVSDYGRPQAGHDFWLTRNGHGAGFWEEETEHAKRLDTASKGFGEQTLYIGDDAQIYAA